MNKSKYIVFEIVLPLLIAGGIYLLFRPEATVVFKIGEQLGLSHLIRSIKLGINSTFFPEWFIYSLPGGLWLLAFQNTITLLKNFSGKNLRKLVILASLTGIGLELLQLVHITDGRFDWMDVLFYAGATVLALSNIWLVNNKWEIYSKEQYSPKLLGLYFLIFTAIIYLADII